MKLIFNRFIYYIALASTLFFAFASVFMYVKVQERYAYVDGLKNLSLAQGTCVSRDDSVLTIARSIYSMTKNDNGVELQKMDWYERFESTFFFNMSSTVALKYGSYGVKGHYVFGPCGTMSRLLLNTLWDLDIPARKLQLLANADGKGGGHTMVEYLDNGKWKVIAVSDSAFVWRTKNGEIASVEEIKADAAVFKQIYEKDPTYPYLFDNTKHINWSKLPVWMQQTIKSILGEKKFNEMVTPELYDQPRHLTLYFSIVLFFISTSVYFFQRRRKTMSRIHVGTKTAGVNTFIPEKKVQTVQILNREYVYEQEE